MSHYETTDLNLTGFLIASGISLQGHRREQEQTIFCLEQTDKLTQLVEDYYNMNAMINPLRYGSALKILKNIVYQRNHNHYDGDKRTFHEQRKVH